MNMFAFQRVGGSSSFPWNLAPTRIVVGVDDDGGWRFSSPETTNFGVGSRAIECDVCSEHAGAVRTTNGGVADAEQIWTFAWDGAFGQLITQGGLDGRSYEYRAVDHSIVVSRTVKSIQRMDVVPYGVSSQPRRGKYDVRLDILDSLGVECSVNLRGGRRFEAVGALLILDKIEGICRSPATPVLVVDAHQNTLDVFDSLGIVSR